MPKSSSFNPLTARRDRVGDEHKLSGLMSVKPESFPVAEPYINPGGQYAVCKFGALHYRIRQPPVSPSLRR